MTLAGKDSFFRTAFVEAPEQVWLPRLAGWCGGQAGDFLSWPLDLSAVRVAILSFDKWEERKIIGVFQ